MTDDRAPVKGETDKPEASFATTEAVNQFQSRKEMQDAHLEQMFIDAAAEQKALEEALEADEAPGDFKATTPDELAKEMSEAGGLQDVYNGNPDPDASHDITDKLGALSDDDRTELDTMLSKASNREEVAAVMEHFNLASKVGSQ